MNHPAAFSSLTSPFGNPATSTTHVVGRPVALPVKRHCFQLAFLTWRTLRSPSRAHTRFAILKKLPSRPRSPVSARNNRISQQSSLSDTHSVSMGSDESGVGERQINDKILKVEMSCSLEFFYTDFTLKNQHKNRGV